MNTLDPTTGSTRSSTKYCVQYGYVGGPVGSPILYWQDDHLSFTALTDAKDRLRALADTTRAIPSRAYTGQLRLVKRTETTTIEPVED